jgi:5'-phosphate synthase pdxT subunit
MTPGKRIGVLAIQGDFARHTSALEAVGARVTEVRTPGDLEGLEGLVLPGGESTAMLKLMERTNLEGALGKFHAGGGALFGTCAGLILLAQRVAGPEQRSLGLLDVDVERNSYGRQIDSFEIDLPWSGNGGPLRGVFIRAPRITRVGAWVQILAARGRDPVLVREGRVLAATFHPELTGDLRVHRYFVEEVARPREPVRS